MRTCKTCDKTMDFSNFELVSIKGKKHYRGDCIDCTNMKRRLKRAANPDKYRKQSKDYWERKGKFNWKKFYAENRSFVRSRAKKYRDTPKGRASALVRQAHLRDTDRCDLDPQEILTIIERGFCERSGVKFDFTSLEGRKVNKFSPSLDRKNKHEGYTKENTQVVAWCYNTGKGEMSDAEFIDFCKQVVRHNA